MYNIRVIIHQQIHCIHRKLLTTTMMQMGLRQGFGSNEVGDENVVAAERGSDDDERWHFHLRQVQSDVGHEPHHPDAACVGQEISCFLCILLLYPFEMMLLHDDDYADGGDEERMKKVIEPE